MIADGHDGAEEWFCLEHAGGDYLRAVSGHVIIGMYSQDLPEKTV
jgi:hypothetical protein